MISAESRARSLLLAFTFACGAESASPAAPLDGRADSAAVLEIGDGTFALAGHELAGRRLRSAPLINIRRLFAEGDSTWAELLFSIDDLFFVHEERRRCGREFGWSVRDDSGTVVKCNFRMGMMLLPESDGRCSIVAAEVTPVPGDDVRYCPEYAKCIAAVRVGRRVSCGSTSAEAGGLSVELFLQALHQPKLFDVDFVGRLIVDHERVASSRPPASDSDDFRIRYMRRIADRYLEYLRWHHEQLRRGAG